MRNIPVKEWVIKNQDGTEGKEDTLIILSFLIGMKKPEELPRGFEQFKLFNKLTRAFEKANETKVLLLEEDSYKFLKNVVSSDIPSAWGGNKNIYEAINAFMEAKEE